jgi:hypothetical protein
MAKFGCDSCQCDFCRGGVLALGVAEAKNCTATIATISDAVNQFFGNNMPNLTGFIHSPNARFLSFELQRANLFVNSREIPAVAISFQHCVALKHIVVSKITSQVICQYCPFLVSITGTRNLQTIA